MTDYVKSTNFASKDSLATGNPLKIVKGTEIDTEFNNIATAVATKADLNSPILIGTPVAPTASAGTNTTQLATTAFVKTAVDNYDSALTVSTSQIEDLAVTNDKIANSTIASAKLANSGVTAGTYGSSAAIPVVTFNAQGQVTSASTTPRGISLGSGSVTNGGTFDIVLGSSGKALITVQGYFVAAFGNFGTGTISISIGGSSVASQSGRTIEYDSRTSGANPIIQYLHTGTVGSTVTVTFSFSGAGSFQNATYSYVGI